MVEPMDMVAPALQPETDTVVSNREKYRDLSQTGGIYMPQEEGTQI